jgi:hypothetical protein
MCPRQWRFLSIVCHQNENTGFTQTLLNTIIEFLDIIRRPVFYLKTTG